MAGFVLHPDAFSDIQDIITFISEDSAAGADQVLGEILHAIEVVVTFPNSGHRRPDLTSGPLRFTHAGNYLIAYAADEIPLLVVAVIHGHRSPRLMASVLRGRE